MNENKTLKVSLGTVLCMFIIVSLVIALILMYYKYNQNNNELTNNQKEENIVLKNSYNKEKSTQINTDTQKSEENIIASENKFIPLSVYTATKKVADENREGYTIIKENNDICLSISDGKVYFTSLLNNEYWSTLGINKNDIKVSEKYSAEITGFTKKVVDAEICCYQTLETMYFVFLMEDGTLEYSSLKNMVTNLTTEGKVKNVSNIQRIHNCAVGFTNTEGSMDTIIALDYENNMYDIGYILNK